MARRRNVMETWREGPSTGIKGKYLAGTDTFCWSIWWKNGKNCSISSKDMARRRNGMETWREGPRTGIKGKWLAGTDTFCWSFRWKNGKNWSSGSKDMARRKTVLPCFNKDHKSLCLYYRNANPWKSRRNKKCSPTLKAISRKSRFSHFSYLKICRKSIF